MTPPPSMCATPPAGEAGQSGHSLAPSSKRRASSTAATWLALCALTLSAACASPRPGRADTVAAVAEPAADEASFVDARLGPHRLRLPLALFRHGLAPTGGRRFDIAMRLPGYEPVTMSPAPGSLAQAGILDIEVLYFDGLPEAHLLSFWLREEPPDASPDPLAGDVPRARGKPLYGLQPYYVDAGDAGRSDARDRYIASSPDAAPTFIECTPRALDDGVNFLDGRPQRRTGAVTDILAVCDHHVALEGARIVVSMRYARALLPRWYSIETHVVGLLREAMTASPAPR